MVATSAETPELGLSGRAINWFPMALGLGVLLAAFAVAFMPSIQWIVEQWSGSSGVLSHGYLVAAISIYLFVRTIPEVVRLPIEPMWTALPVLLVLSITWLFGYVATIIAVQSVVLPAILITAVASAFGRSIASRFAFPVLFIYFAIPAVEHLQFIFQAITVFAISILLRVTDIPALVQGNFVMIPQGTFEIAGGCSGLNFIIAGVSLAVFYGHLYYTRVQQNVQLIATILAVAMFGNWVRVFSVIVIGYRSDMQSSLVHDHLTVGWILFAVLMIPVYFVARRMEDSSDKPSGSTHSTNVHAASGQLPSWFAISIAASTMVIGPVWANAISTPDQPAESLAIEFPAGTSGWTGPNESHWGWQPEYTGVDAESVVEYQLDSEVVLVYANVYLMQDQGRELISFSSDINGDWRALSNNDGLPETVTLDDGREYGQSVASNYVGDWLIWYRYRHGDVFDTSAGQAKISQAIQTLKGNPGAGVVAYATPCRTRCSDAAHLLTNFVGQFDPTIDLNLMQEQE